MPPAADALTLPDGFTLVRRLGEGGYGEVWQGTAPGGFPVALKFLRLDPSALATELRALEVIKSIRHAHLLTLLGVWPHGSSVMVAMELADCTLLDRAKKYTDGVLPRGELLEYLRQAADALDYLNLHSVQHRDVKPQNLLLVMGGILKVGDFGLAKLMEHTITTASGRMTPAYAAPEFFDNKATAWSDQYSLAVTYCQLRGGRLPYAGTTQQIVAGHLTRPPDLTMLPENERTAVAQALAKDPRQRWSTCRAFVEELRRLDPAEPVARPGQVHTRKAGPVVEAPPTRPEQPALDLQPTPAGRVTVGQPAPRQSRWPMSLAVVCALLTPLLVVGVVVLVGGWQPASTSAPREANRTEAEAVAELRHRGATLTAANDRPDAPVLRARLKGDVQPETLALLRDLRHLEEVDLSESMVSDAGLANLAPLAGIRKLSLHACPQVTDEGLRHLAALSSLEELGLSDTKIGDAGLANLRPLSRLRSLSCWGCKNLTDRGLPNLVYLGSLDFLVLNETSISDAGLEHLKPLNRLKYLWVAFCPNVSQSGAAALTEDMPKLCVSCFRTMLPEERPLEKPEAPVRPETPNIDKPVTDKPEKPNIDKPVTDKPEKPNLDKLPEGPAPPPTTSGSDRPVTDKPSDKPSPPRTDKPLDRPPTDKPVDKPTDKPRT